MRRLLNPTRGGLVAFGLLAAAACTGEIGVSPTGDPDATPADCHLSSDDTLVRRLTRYEYQNTVRDVLGVEVGAAIEALPADPRAEGFSNNADTLVVSFKHVAAYDTLAESVTAQLDMSELIGTYGTCTDFSPTCERSFIDGLGLRMFRRPVTDIERALYEPLFDAAETEGDDFSVGAELVTRAMLQAPPFLYRLEAQKAPAGATVRWLSGYEVASRLSYLLIGTAPDTALLDAARNDALKTEAQIRTHTLRLLEQPAARATARRYMREWLALDALDDLTRDPAVYPEWNPTLAAAMKEETLSLFDHLVWEEPGPLTDLLTAQYTYASAELADLYGLDNPQSGPTPLDKYDLHDHPERVGLLTHASFQTVTGIGNRPNLVARGVFMLYGMLCSEVAAPPAQVDTSMAQSLPDQSDRYYSAERLENKVCVTCHAQFDPLAYAFERYDGIGRYVLQDEHGNALKQDGWVPKGQGEPETDYDNIAEFANLLAQSKRVRRCFVEKPLQFALGRPLETSDTCTLERVAQTTETSGGQYQAMVLAIALDPTFRQIAVDTNGGTP